MHLTMTVHNHSIILQKYRNKKKTLKKSERYKCNSKLMSGKADFSRHEGRFFS